jgi:hypothetical protein
MTKFILFTETPNTLLDEKINNWITENPANTIIDWKIIMAEHPTETGYCGPIVMIQYVEPCSNYPAEKILECNEICKGVLCHVPDSK